MPVLRLELYQPSAHYRLPYAYQRRLTYPLPPYSTILGFLQNLVSNHKAVKDYLVPKPEVSDIGVLPLTHIAVAGRFYSKTVEYTWLRSLKAEKGSERRDKIFSFPEHPGQQIPVKVDTLERVELVIYLGAAEEFLSVLKEAISNPQPYEIPHLGRAEDFVILDSVEVVELRQTKVKPKHYPYSFWVPYEEAQQLKLEGLLFKIALKAENRVMQKASRGKGSKSSKPADPMLFSELSPQGPIWRVMQNVPVLLWEGELPYAIEAYFDSEKEIPVFLQPIDA
ncbi:MAG: type I-B CRISPR-associated protein Cas5b [Bacteroidia bacterium]|nr:type I-B CRISPR-associated protein Cas5b [Bacteroidia bacterium]